MASKTESKTVAVTPHMSVDIGGVRFKNPVMTASGTFAYGVEFAHLMDLSSIGGIVVKGISMQPIKGNPPPAHLRDRFGHAQRDRLAEHRGGRVRDSKAAGAEGS